MILTTARLALSFVTPTDLEAVHALHLLPETDRFNTMGIPENKEQTQKLLNEWLGLMQERPPKKYVFCLRDAENAVVGIAGINIGRLHYRDAEIWYKLYPSHWNKGYATETVMALLKHCFETLKLHRVQAGCAVENTASVRVLEKAGFLREGHCRKKLPIRGEWVDNYEFAVLKEDYCSQ
jgi:[ribosomal protein S5]-alanine N-acetyltransferase